MRIKDDRNERYLGAIIHIKKNCGNKKFRSRKFVREARVSSSVMAAMRLLGMIEGRIPNAKWTGPDIVTPEVVTQILLEMDRHARERKEIVNEKMRQAYYRKKLQEMPEFPDDQAEDSEPPAEQGQTTILYPEIEETITGTEDPQDELVQTVVADDIGQIIGAIRRLEQALSDHAVVILALKSTMDDMVSEIRTSRMMRSLSTNSQVRN